MSDPRTATIEEIIIKNWENSDRKVRIWGYREGNELVLH
jgi:hypothetical protein